MYNILLTDDEQIVIDSLSFIIRRNFPQQAELFPALSGTEALETARTRNIDIMFMDISMPGLNGLETISRIRQFKPGIVIIILSAFDRFQYAQEAINLGAFKYLTKPVNRNLIVQTVRGAMDMVDREREKLSSDIEMHEKLHFVSSIVESDFIYSGIFSGNRNADLSSYLDYFNIRTDTWFLCCVEIPHLEQKDRYEVYLAVRTIFTSAGNCIIGSFMLNRLVVFFPVEQKDTGTDRIRTMMRDIFRRLAVSVSSDVRLGISSLKTGQADMVPVYAEALKALNQTPVDGGIMFASEKKVSEPDRKETADLSRKLLSRLRAGDSASVRLLAHIWCENQCALSVADSDKIKNAVFELLVTAGTIVKEVNPLYYNSASENAFSFLNSTNDPQALEQFLQKRFSEYVTAVSESYVHRESPVIKNACTYIDAHLAESVSLKQIADEVHVSPFYLSKLFKDEKGENFISYVTMLRLEKAKQLLSNGILSIKEISARIGYNDQNYFSKLFRHTFGVTPTEFRIIEQKKQEESI